MSGNQTRAPFFKGTITFQRITGGIILLEKNWRGEVVMFRGEEIDNKLHGDVGEF